LSDVTNEKLLEFIPFFTPVARFVVITLATYLVIALTAVAAAVIPAVRACNTRVADALREE
jgi:ABC-type lipoprotein release transport system permease subunit